MRENSLFDRKSIKIITGKTADWDELAKDCVCFANAEGGELHIGIEDDETLPPVNQKISNSLIEKINKTIPALTVNIGIEVRKEIAENGGEYIRLIILRNRQSIASTSNGKYYVRISDTCQPVMPEDLLRLASDKSAFIWEEKVVRKIHYSECDRNKLSQLVDDIKNSERISDFVKNKSTEEQLEYYQLVRGEFLTNLGVLWIGTQQQRAGLLYAPSIQFIKYDDLDRKVFKRTWDDFTKNPKELLDDIVNTIPDWNEFIEVSDGLFRKNIYNFEPEVIREIVANALAHRNYSMRGDIFINLYPDRLEIHSPGLLPLGVTPDNILTKSVQRNHLLAKLFYDLKLMEKEGSGYDKVYEILLSNAKRLPEVEEGDDRVVVTIYKNIIKADVLQIMQKASEEFILKQKEIISLGLIAQHESIHALELSKLLNVTRPNGLQNWLGRLPELKLILSKGKTKGTIYYVNPDFLRATDFKAKTTLKRIEPYRLKELILADLKDYPDSSISEIHERIGIEINIHTLKNKLDDLMKEDLIDKKGEKKGTKYFIK